jgi:galactofuranose transport system ATP-binding protein
VNRPAAAAPGSAPPALELVGIDKHFLGVHALSRVSLRLFAGEVHALMGQNGAGKSTLIKVLTGVYPADSGEMRLGGVRVHPHSPLHAQQLGISTVYQEVNLCANLSVAENIFAGPGRYPRSGAAGAWRIDWRAMNRQAVELLARLNLKIDVTRLLSSYSVAVQQMVAIARALSVSSKVLILDEPTSSLDDDEVKLLFAVLRQLRSEGLAILFVTHFLDQVYEIADRITVLRNGEWVGEAMASKMGPSALIAAMIGREFVGHAATAPAAAAAVDDHTTPLLQTQGLAQRGRMFPIDLSLHAGEVLGLGGLLGSGRTELARLLFGLATADQGELRIAGQTVRLSGPADAVRLGLGLCPEDRKTEGVVAELTVRENIVLALQARHGVWRFLPREQTRAIAQRFVAMLDIKTPDTETPMGQLSGGNQQKALLARWLATDPKLLILDEPTRGIDVAAKQEIMDQILQLAERGMAVLFISSEMNEVVRVSHRIVVLRDRRKVGELPAGSSEQAVYHLIAAET